MAEKVRVTQVTVKGEYKGKDYFKVFLEDGRVGTCFNEKIKDFVEKEVELDIKTKEYQGQTELNFYFPKAEGSGGYAFKGKNYEFERKRVALECASRIAAGGRIEVTEIPHYAENFEKYLKG